jgi:hypothetical protein
MNPVLGVLPEGLTSEPVHRSWARRLGWLRYLTAYTYHFFLLGLIPGAFLLDIHTRNIGQQNVLGIMAFLILFAWTRLSPPSERRQVWIMVAIATCIEIWSSIIWGIYRYRFGNMPLFVPWGHGLVYLFALRAARTPLLERYGTMFSRLAYVCATGWAVFGLTLEPLLFGRLDVTGAMFWPIFAWFMQRKSAPIYAAAFFITSYLELIGTHIGNWAWQTYAPISGIATGNPPSVISAGYCVMDFSAILIATSLPTVGIWSQWRLKINPPPIIAVQEDVA